MKSIVVNVKKGRKVSEEVYEGAVNEVVKEVILKVLPLWRPEDSDLIVTKHHITELVSNVKEDFHVYVISFSSTWVGDELIEEEIIAVFPQVSKELQSQIEQTLLAYSLSE